MATQEQIQILWDEQEEILNRFRGGTHPKSDGATGFGSLVELELEDMSFYLSSEENAQFGWSTLVDMSQWYLRNGSLHILNNKEMDISYLNRSALGYYWGAVMGDAVGHAVYDKSPYWSWRIEAGPALGLNMMMGWLDKAEAIARVYHRSLVSHETLLISKADADYRAPWFLFELMADYLGLKFDKSTVEYPSDMWPYNKVLADWQTTDLLQLDKLVYEMGEYHLDQSKEAVGEDDNFEFQALEWWLLPYEILAFLKLRECIGLDNPTEWSHPLMQESVCQLPTGIAETPEFPLLNEFLAKLEVDHPEIFEGKGAV